MKTIIRIFLLLGLALNLSAQSPKHEVRAVWLTTIQNLDWPRSRSVYQQKQELISILDQLQKANINTVLLQTRVRASTIYPSAIEPWDVCMTGIGGQSPGYDPLQFCIDECHKRGMQCHAWMVTIPVGKWNTDGCKKIRQKLPKLIKKVGEEGYMDPENPQTGDYIARMCEEVTRRYDIDGIHLDYIRYPETWKLKVSRSEGRRNITAIVRKIHQAVKSVKPWVMISCSPIGKFDDLSRYRSGGWNAYTAVCQDAQGWLRDGLMDALFPMMYFQGNNFYPFAVDWKQHSYGRIIAPGLAAYMLHPREKNWSLDVVTREMNVLRELGLGVTFFRSKFFTDNTKGLYTFTQDFNQYPALIPPMTWVSRRQPAAVGRLNISRSMNSDLLTWTGSRSSTTGDYLLYNVYASDTYPVDTRDSRNLIATRLQGQALSVPHKGKTLHYAVTTTDRYGNESNPTMTRNTSSGSRKPIDFRQLMMGNKLKKYK
ncbi:MAG: family 10 glycosylhydrolase [Prevotella sp.]|nr:family 10 glycosylhydrolase [Prevotella sp.]